MYLKGHQFTNFSSFNAANDAEKTVFPNLVQQRRPKTNPGPMTQRGRGKGDYIFWSNTIFFLHILSNKIQRTIRSGLVVIHAVKFDVDSDREICHFLQQKKTNV